MKIKLNIDTTQLTRVLNTVARQVPYAAANALNATAKEIQTAQRQRVEKDFTLRRKTFILNTIKIERGGWAKKNNLRVRLGIDPRRNVLAKFERGGEKVSTDRSRPEIVPMPALRPTRQRSIPTWAFPKNLRLMERRTPSGVLAAKSRISRRGIRVWEGKRRTFVLDPNEHMGVGMWGVYQRVGRKRKDVRALWLFTRRVKVPRMLGFEETTREVADRRFGPNFQDALSHAIRTAKVR
jgi:hypothetical protein